MSLYDNIHKKRKRIAKGSGEKMNKPGTKDAPSKKDFKDAAKTAKKPKKKKTTTMTKKKKPMTKKKTNGASKKTKR